MWPLAPLLTVFDQQVLLMKTTVKKKRFKSISSAASLLLQQSQQSRLGLPNWAGFLVKLEPNSLSIKLFFVNHYVLLLNIMSHSYRVFEFKHSKRKIITNLYNPNCFIGRLKCNVCGEQRAKKTTHMYKSSRVSLYVLLVINPNPNSNWTGT